MPVMDSGFRYATQSWETDGVRVNYDLAFTGGYLYQADVLAFREPFDGTDVTGPREDLAVTFVSETDDDNGNHIAATVRVGATPATPQPLGYRVTIYRSTEKGSPLLDFEDGAMQTGANLNLMVKQAIFDVAELTDLFNNVDDNTQQNLQNFENRIAAVEEDVDENTAAVAAANATAASAVATANSALTAAQNAEDAIGPAIDAANAATAAAADATAAANAATDALADIEADVQAAVDTANAASAQAQAAADVALGLGDEIDAANATATTALNTANAIDAKAQMALDNSVQAQDDASDALAAATTAAADAAAAVATANSVNADAVKKSPTAVQVMEGPLASKGLFGSRSTRDGMVKHAMGNADGSVAYGGLFLDADGVTFKNATSGKGVKLLDTGDARGDTTLELFAGTVGVQKYLLRFGWGNNVPRWQGSLEANGNFHITGWDSAGANGRLQMRFQYTDNAPGNSAVTVTTGIGTSSALGSVNRPFCIEVLNNNTDRLETVNYRKNGAGTGWDTCVYRMQRVIDNVGYKGYIDFDTDGGGRGLSFGFNGTEMGYMLSSGGGWQFIGTVYATAGFQPGSSRKIKTDTRPIKNALATLDSIELCIGRLKKDWAPVNQERRYFAIAESAEAKASELITPDAMDYKGEKIPSFDYNGLSVLNSAAIKELLSIIQEQQRQIDELKELL